MQPKSARGVQQADIWAAADELIAEGLRPTIERVRQKMGRGSPNTVSPMLDAWFASLGARLAVNQNITDIDAIPPLVYQSMEKLWEMALVNARKEAALQTARIQASLEEKGVALASQAAALARREQLQAERMAANEEALVASRMQVEELRAQSAHFRQSVKDRETETALLRARIEAIERDWEAARRKAEDESALQARERVRADERAASTERRLLQEVDRARQETRLLRVSTADGEKRNASQQIQKDELLRTRSSELSVALEQRVLMDRDITAMREALATANFKTEKLESLLDKQQLASETIITKLTTALASGSRRGLQTSDLKNRKFKSTVVRRRQP